MARAHPGQRERIVWLARRGLSHLFASSAPASATALPSPLVPCELALVLPIASCTSLRIVLSEPAIDFWILSALSSSFDHSSVDSAVDVFVMPPTDGTITLDALLVVAENMAAPPCSAGVGVASLRG